MARMNWTRVNKENRSKRAITGCTCGKADGYVGPPLQVLQTQSDGRPSINSNTVSPEGAIDCSPGRKP
jgi:hypothetical protein